MYTAVYWSHASSLCGTIQMQTRKESGGSWSSDVEAALFVLFRKPVLLSRHNVDSRAASATATGRHETSGVARSLLTFNRLWNCTELPQSWPNTGEVLCIECVLLLPNPPQQTAAYLR